MGFIDINITGIIYSFAMNDMDGFVLYYIMVIMVFTMNDKNGLIILILFKWNLMVPLIWIKIPTVCREKKTLMEIVYLFIFTSTVFNNLNGFNRKYMLKLINRYIY
jgi:hypothetical protein